MGTLAEYAEKTKGPFDGKLKLRVWVVSVWLQASGVDQMVAVFTDEGRAESFRMRYGSRGRKARWLVDVADDPDMERVEFMKALKDMASEEIDPAEERFLRAEFEKSLHDEEE